MRSGPPLEIDIVRFGVWRAAVLALSGIVCATMAAWWLAQPAPVPASVSVLAALGVASAVAGALAGLRLPPVTLRRSGGLWHLQRGASPPAPGDLAVAIDLGGWMLLRFVPGAGGGRARWIALQRHGLEPQWHALRCAVYAPRPAALALSETGND